MVQLSDLNRHYHPNAPARSKKHVKRCSELCIDPAAPIRLLADGQTGTGGAIMDAEEVAASWPEAADTKAAAASLPLSLPSELSPRYVLSARLWRELPRQFWPAWRAAIRRSSLNT